MVKSGFWRTSSMFLIGFLALSNANIRAQETETLEALVQRLEKLSLNNRKEAFELSKIAISRAENELKRNPTPAVFQKCAVTAPQFFKTNLLDPNIPIISSQSQNTNPPMEV